MRGQCGAEGTGRSALGFQLLTSFNQALTSAGQLSFGSTDSVFILPDQRNELPLVHLHSGLGGGERLRGVRTLAVRRRSLIAQRVHDGGIGERTLHGHFSQPLHQSATLARKCQSAGEHQRMLERIGLEGEARQIGARRTEKHASRVTANGIGQCEGVGVTQHEAKSESEHLGSELLRRKYIAAIGQFSQQQHRHGAGRVGEHEAHEGIERTRLELRGDSLQRAVVRYEVELRIELGEQAGRAHWRRGTIAETSVRTNADVYLTVHRAARTRGHHVRYVSGPLQRPIERIGRVNHDVGQRRSTFTVRRPTEDTSTIERVVRGRIPVQLLALVESEPRDTRSEESRVRFCRRRTRRQIKV